jgi:orotidine-5'-phosphate decarboxylase
MTPIDALKQGADKLVIGREVTKSDNPLETIQGIYHTIMNFNYALN